MNVGDLESLLNDVFDLAIVHHGYTDYMRDYEVVVYVPAASDRDELHLRYLFRHCVEAHCATTIPPEVWRRSLDDRLLEGSAAADGYVWGVRWHELYPGGKVVPDSPAARRWAKALGVDFHEVRIETNAHDLRLVFAELVVTELPDYTS